MHLYTYTHTHLGVGRAPQQTAQQTGPSVLDQRLGENGREPFSVEGELSQEEGTISECTSWEEIHRIYSSHNTRKHLGAVPHCVGGTP